MKIRAICGLLVALSLGLTGCTDTYEQGYKDGLAEGYETGYNEGTRDGSSLTALKYESQWGLWGLFSGTLLGGAIVALLTRRYIAAEFQKWRRRREVTLALRKTEVDFDEDIFERVVAVGIRKRRLEEELSRDGGHLMGAAQVPLVGTLAGFEDGVLKVATLLQQLRRIRTEVTVDDAKQHARLKRLEQSLSHTADHAERNEITGALEIERQKTEAAKKNAANIRRCELKLESLNTFLDNLIIHVGNIRTAEEQSAFDNFESQVSGEIAALQRTYEETLRNLLN